MGPRVGRVDVGRDPQELLVEAVEGREVLAGKPVVADVRALEHVVAVRAWLLRVAGHDLEAELGGEFPVAVVDGADDLAAHLQHAPIVELHALDAAADAGARLDHDDIRARAGEVAGAGESAEPSADDDHIRLHLHASISGSAIQRKGVRSPGSGKGFDQARPPSAAVTPMRAHSQYSGAAKRAAVISPSGERSTMSPR